VVVDGAELPIEMLYREVIDVDEVVGEGFEELMLLWLAIVVTELEVVDVEPFSEALEDCEVLELIEVPVDTQMSVSAVTHPLAPCLAGSVIVGRIRDEPASSSTIEIQSILIESLNLAGRGLIRPADYVKD